MAKCPNCGEKINRGAVSCPVCGWKRETAPSGDGTPGNKKIRIIIALSLVVVCLIAVVCVVAGIFSGSSDDGEWIELDELPEEITETVPADFQAVHEYWEGDWYGWWIISDATGMWEEYEGGYWDACARITFTGENTASIKIWDEDDRDEATLSAVQAVVENGSSNIGCMIPESGTFMDMELEYASWVCDPALKFGVGDFENMLFFSGLYVSPDNEKDSFEYLVFLRPWGMEWEDVRTGDTSNCAYDVMMPVRYDDWYLPKIRAGVTSAPAVFDPE